MPSRLRIWTSKLTWSKKVKSSRRMKSQAKLIHGIHLVMAKNYSENLREEVKKGMREKLSQGGFPGHAPFGYRNNKAERTIEIDPVDSVIVIRLFDLYAT
jgi:site-specific DNA recombinase